MIKLKGLKPSLREKKRYIVYEVLSEKTQSNKVTDAQKQKVFREIDMKSFQDELIKKITLLLGVFTPAGLLPIKFDNKSKKGIIRVNHTAVDQVRSCFVLINNINNNPVTINTVGVSGILKKAKEKYFEK